MASVSNFTVNFLPKKNGLHVSSLSYRVYLIKMIAARKSRGMRVAGAAYPKNFDKQIKKGICATFQKRENPNRGRGSVLNCIYMICVSSCYNVVHFLIGSI